MYKNASQNQQRRADFIRPADLADSGPEILSPQVQWENLKLAVQNLERRILAEPDKEIRKDLGVQKLALQGEIKELKRLMQVQKVDLNRFLMNELKKLVPKARYDIAVKDARKAFEDWQAAGCPELDF
jgi:uncharacterized protein YdiU (UPF0061 family)